MVEERAELIIKSACPGSPKTRNKETKSHRVDFGTPANNRGENSRATTTYRFPNRLRTKPRERGVVD
jgi:hypothetical protein